MMFDSGEPGTVLDFDPPFTRRKITRIVNLCAQAAAAGFNPFIRLSAGHQGIHLFLNNSPYNQVQQCSGRLFWNSVKEMEITWENKGDSSVSHWYPATVDNCYRLFWWLKNNYGDCYDKQQLAKRGIDYEQGICLL